MQSTNITFLPCRHGGGYLVTISGFWGNHDIEGWIAGAYANLHGVAVEPEPECLERSEWVRVVRRRLREQGVVFVPRQKVQSYLDTEGAYWIERWGATGEWHGVGQWQQVRTPSFRERLIWRWKPPPTPLNDEVTRVMQHASTIRFTRRVPTIAAVRAFLGKRY